LRGKKSAPDSDFSEKGGSALGVQKRRRGWRINLRDDFSDLRKGSFSGEKKGSKILEEGLVAEKSPLPLSCGKGKRGRLPIRAWSERGHAAGREEKALSAL